MKMPLLGKDAPACCLLDENSMFLPRQKLCFSARKSCLPYPQRRISAEVLKIAPYHMSKFGGVGKLLYLCIVIQRKMHRSYGHHAAKAKLTTRGGLPDKGTPH